MMHPEIARIMVSDRIEQLRQAAAPRPARPAAAPLDEAAVELRLCRVGDDPALEELAALEGRAVEAGRYVVVELDGRIAAALPLGGGAPLADPFVRTAHLLPLLELRAKQINGVGHRTWAVTQLLPHRA